MAEVAPFRGGQAVHRCLETDGAPVLPSCAEDSPLTLSSQLFSPLFLEGDVPDLLRTCAESEGCQPCEDSPALYLYEIVHVASQGGEAHHKGLVALMRLEDFRSGVVSSHQRAHDGEVACRFRQLEQCPVQTEAPLALYSDPCCVIEALAAAEKKRPADVEITLSPRECCRIWRVSSTSFVERVQGVLDRKALLLIEGQAAYLAALRYRDHMRELTPDFSGKESFNYAMVALSNQEDLSLRLFAGQRLLDHRLIPPAQQDAGLLLAGLGHFFDISALADGDCTGAGLSVPTGLEQSPDEIGADWQLALCVGGKNSYALRFRDDEKPAFLRADEPWSLVHCAPLLLERLVMEQVLKLDPALLEDFQCVAVSPGAKGWLADGVADQALVFFLRSPSLAVLRDLVHAGLTLPSRSTFAYPVLPPGVLLHFLSSDERVAAP
ncbi:MAG: DUF1015 family protein [Desulfuromonadaceae bacterium]|nr:DUF1015 family protein [Desulfuromonadaceae bacterium]